MILTDKQKKFVNEYMIDLNATQAAIRSGYSKKTAQKIGSENLSKPLIKAEIERLQGETIQSLQITKESLINDLMEIKELCKTDKKFINNSIKAIEVLNKMLGFNEPEKQDITSKGESIVWNENKTYPLKGE